MGKYFGTDGFRGEANITLTADHAYRIGRFLGWYFTDKAQRKCKVVIGKDTRRSSYMFEYALVAGLTASGADAYLLHVTTTPSVSYVTRTEDFDCGIMISASHNPFYDNGIKLLNSNGEKMEEETLLKVEDYLDGITGEVPYAEKENIGTTVDYAAGRNRYVGYLISLATRSYAGKKVGLDCANGSAWTIAKSVFDALGAKTYVINNEPNGLNINTDCGSTHIEGLQKYVVENGLDVGFAFDGDADRCIAVDENGNEVDGDAMIYILGKRMKMRGTLNDNTVVTTIMSNSGFVDSLTEAGIKCVQTKVGDRFVYECMKNNDYAIGGEQSGHIILKKYATTGDGILTAIMIAEELCDSKSSLAKLAEPIHLYPQYLKNVRVKNKAAVLADAKVLKAKEEVEKLINKKGRVLLRESGTEPVIRVMVESESQEKCVEYADMIVKVITEGGHCVE